MILKVSVLWRWGAEKLENFEATTRGLRYQVLLNVVFPNNSEKSSVRFFAAAPWESCSGRVRHISPN